MNGQLLYIIIMLLEAAVIVGLIITNAKLSKKNKQTDSLLSNYKEKLREDELDESIKNEYYKQDKYENDWKNIPYEETFEEEAHVRTRDAICVHFECISRISSSKYIINIMDELYLGRAESNGIVFEEEDVDQKHIHFVRQNGRVYVQSISDKMPVTFVRQDTKYELGDSLVMINDGDELLFKNSRVVITLV